MSGIAGIVCLNGQAVNPSDVATMLNTLTHRGPDGHHSWLQDTVGLGHRMLWTTPESLFETLPLVSSTGDLVLTADARIDNRESLLEELALGDRPLEKIADSEFILAAYQKWGVDCSKHLLGAFAFALWDASTQSLFCARDHLGVKPFYYAYQAGQSLLLASEIKALLALPQVSRDLNPVRLGDYIALMMNDKCFTSYQNVLRLPPAHNLLLTTAGLKTWSYWSLDPDYELTLDSKEAYAEKFRQLFTEAVRCRLRSAFSVGSHLSGGLDSSAITCVARQLLADSPETPLHTFSNIFDTVTECDERPYIQAVLDQGGLTPYYVQADQFGPLQDTADIWQYEDEALLGPSHSYPWHLNRASQQAGVRIVLDGLDGDTTISHGFARLHELAQQGNWTVFCDEAEGLAKNFDRSTRNIFKQYGYPVLKQWGTIGRWWPLLQAIQKLHSRWRLSRKRLWVECGLRPWKAQLKRRLHFDKAPKDPAQAAYLNLVKPSFATQINLEHRLHDCDQPACISPTAKEEHWRALTHGILPFVLEQLDRCAAAYSLEVRHPFMDKRLIEFCLALPAEQKLSQGWSRMILRRALAGILPEAVQWRGGKADMTANFLHGLLVRDRQQLDDIMRNQLEPLEPYINLNVLSTAYGRMVSNQTSQNTDHMAVWRAVILTLWLQRHQ
ncbi:MAG: lasso peptide isopeptide bond-forming cyclase [Cyanobacteria bacterium P01_F01_bin.86]